MLQAKLREAISSYRRGAFAPTTSPGTRPSSRAATATAASRRKSVAPQAYAAPAPAPAALAAAAAAGGGGGVHRSHTPSRSSSCASLADSVTEAQQASYAPGASAAGAGGGGGAVRKGRKSMAGLPLRVTEGAGGYTSQLSSIPDGHAAAALPGEWPSAPHIQRTGCWRVVATKAGNRLQQPPV
jgi:hypothetical protein